MAKTSIPIEITESRQRKIIAISVIVFVLLAALIVFLDWNQIHQIMGKAHWPLALVALLFIIISYCCLSFGYVLVTRVFGIKMGWWKVFEVGVVSTTLNNILGFMGTAGHSLRVELIKGPEIDAGEVLASSIFHSYLNNVMLLVMLALGLIALLVSRTVYGGSAVGLWLIAAVLIVSLVASTAIIFVPQFKSRLFHLIETIWHFFTHHDIAPFLKDFDHALTRGLITLKNRQWELTLLLALMAGEWAFEAVALWFCFGALGKTPNVGVLLSGFGIGLSAGNLSFIPGGLGVQEASMAGIYALLGMSFAQAALVAILFRVVSDFIPFFISLPFYERLLQKKVVIKPTLSEKL
ncbi:MAG: flippase-like domain-containing protein [Smithellaceae bacterium]|jgi:uncharacterized protein (TIRG00374 family)